MGYQTKFNPGPDFEWAVRPFLSSLPASSSSPPLEIKLPSSDLNKAKWQWYNFFRHKARGLFQLKVEALESGEILIRIFRRGGSAQTMSGSPFSVPQEASPSEDSDERLESDLAEVLEKMEGGEKDEAKENNGQPDSGRTHEAREGEDKDQRQTYGDKQKDLSPPQ
jgi:hypothetical protein